MNQHNLCVCVCVCVNVCACVNVCVRACESVTVSQHLIFETYDNFSQLLVKLWPTSKS